MKYLLFTLILALSATQALAQNNAQVYECSEETALMKAVINSDIEKLKQLIKSGEDVNAVAYREQPSAGKPVLRYAIDSHCLEAVQILLKSGANPNDLTVSPITTQDGKANIRNLSLLSHAINSNAPISIIKELINKGANIDGSPKIAGDWSALMVAAYRGYVEAVKVLLDFKEDINSINQSDNKTALDYAKEQKHPAIVKLLEKKLKHKRT